MGLIITFVLGFTILLGACIAKLASHTKFVEQISVAIAFGSMGALAVLEILPEAIENTWKISGLILPAGVAAGIIMLKILDHFIPEHDHAHGLHHDCSDQNIVHIGVVASAAVILHNLIEGMAVYSMVQESVSVGSLMAVGVGLHNIPMGMVIYSTLQKERRTPKLIILFMTCISTFLGGVSMLLLWDYISEAVIGVLMSITLGMLIYIVFLELLPHILHGKNKKLSAAGAVLGIILILITKYLEG